MRRSRLSVELLRDDDEGYATWLAVNVGGYVLNIQRSLIPSDARIHGAACHTINETLPRGRTWTGSYVKACSFSLPELQAWAPTHAGSAVTRCGTCQPSLPGQRVTSTPSTRMLHTADYSRPSDPVDALVDGHRSAC